MMAQHDAPPPPYSETDIYSCPAHSPLGRTRSNNNNNTSDDASIAASSSHSNIIYTPPETPRDSHYNFGGPEDIQTTASAQVYFETRPATGRLANSTVIHQITISDDPAPADFPYPGWGPNRDTSEQDWRTFINYLIPDYAEKANAGIIHRKLQAEDDARSTATTRDIAEAQLEQLRSSSQRRRFDDTAREWNAGFFAPRGVTIRLNLSSLASSPRMPGAWDDSFNTGTRASAPEPDSQEQGGWRSMFGPRFGREGNNRGGLRLGPITIDGDRVAIGKSFEADSRGVRWNGRDISDMPGGSSSFPFRSPGGPRGGESPAGPSHSREWSSGERGRGRGWSHDHHERRGGPGFGSRRRSRSDSCSSSSSSSSSSSNSSASSIGSLPAWDDLKDSQIPVVSNSVQSWLSRPDQPVTKDECKRVKAEIQAAKSLPPGYTTIDKGSREEVRALLSQWNGLKKKKGERKEGKRERKEIRRAEREFDRGQRCGHGHGHGVPGPADVSTMSEKYSFPDGPGLSAPRAQGLDAYGPGPAGFFGPGRSGGPGFFGGRGGPTARRGFGHRGGHHDHDPDREAHDHYDYSGPRCRNTPSGSGPRWQDMPGATPDQIRAQAQAQAQEQAALAVAGAREQVRHARAQAHIQAEQSNARTIKAREAALQQAEESRANAAKQAENARAHAAKQVEKAKAEAARHVENAKLVAAQHRETGWRQAEQGRAHAKAQAARHVENAKVLAAQHRGAAIQQAAAARSEAQATAAQASSQAQATVAQASSQAQSTAGRTRSAAKYQEAEQIEAQIDEKMIAHRELEERLQAEGIAAARAGNGDSKMQSQTQVDAERLEQELDELWRRVEGLRIEGDEEFARELEREEAEKPGYSGF
ncbi:hypothetical protein BJ170DRAFT_212881 [Xylariales sp. AK1849]|nr:hypothetical protein BJ170DRAFT_212881 [Xylariales sp. AK1849]